MESGLPARRNRPVAGSFRGAKRGAGCHWQRQCLVTRVSSPDTRISFLSEEEIGYLMKAWDWDFRAAWGASSQTWLLPIVIRRHSLLIAPVTKPDEHFTTPGFLDHRGTSPSPPWEGLQHHGCGRAGLEDEYVYRSGVAAPHRLGRREAPAGHTRRARRLRAARREACQSARGGAQAGAQGPRAGAATGRCCNALTRSCCCATQPRVN